MKAKLVRYVGATVVVMAYALTLLTQIPHVYDVYAGLEKEGHSITFGSVVLSTALGAAVAFEISVAIFTWRTIVNTSTYRSPWTKRGIIGFLFLSALANLSYYFDIAVGSYTLDEHVMPFFMALALPIALWLYAEEFGAETGKAARKVIREDKRAHTKPGLPYDPTDYRCFCGRWAPDPERHKTAAQAEAGLNGHLNTHRREARDWGGGPGNVRTKLAEKYAADREKMDNPPTLPTVIQISAWIEKR